MDDPDKKKSKTIKLIWTLVWTIIILFLICSIFGLVLFISSHSSTDSLTP